jgi:hypothetical protein
MTDIGKFSISLQLGATFKSGDDSWTKPGVETSITFNGIPEKEQLDMALSFMEREILEPVLREVADAAIKYNQRAAGLGE